MTTAVTVIQRRREHLLELQRDFGFQPFTESLSSKLADGLLPDALRSPKPMPLIAALLGPNANAEDHRAGILDRGKPGMGDPDAC